VRLPQLLCVVECTQSYAYYACQLGPKTRKRSRPIPQPILAYQSIVIVVWKLLVEKASMYSSGKPCKE